MNGFPRPRGFKPAGAFRWVEETEKPSWVKTTKAKGRRRKGLLYEQKVKEHLAAEYGNSFCPGPWLKFGPPERWCQPDGLIILPNEKLAIVEIKLQHTAQAWWQLFQLYEPVVERAYPEFRVRCVEVVKWFDPATHCPEDPRLLEDLGRPRPGFNVHILKP